MKTTLRIIRNTPVVESPTWLTARIMSNIVEQPVISTNTAEKKQADNSTTTQKTAVTDKSTEPDANRATIQDRSESGAAKMKKAAPAREGQALESSAPASASNGFTPVPAVDLLRIRISRIMGLDTLSAKTVRQAVYRSGGTVLPSEAARADRQLTARIPVTKLDDLFAQLEKQARIVERPAVAKSIETVVIDILW